MVKTLLQKIEFLELESKGLVTYNELNDLLGDCELFDDFAVEELLDELEKRNIRVITVRQLKHPKSIKDRWQQKAKTDIKLTSTELLLKSLDSALSTTEDKQREVFKELIEYKKQLNEIFYKSLFPLFFLYFEYKDLIPQNYDSFIMLFSSNKIIMRIKFDSIKEEFSKFLRENMEIFENCYKRSGDFNELSECVGKSGIAENLKGLNFKKYIINQLEHRYINKYYDFRISSIKDDLTVALYKYCYSYFDEIKKLKSKIDLNREYLTRSYMKLIVRIAQSYLKKGIEFNDLVQEGNKALIEAIESINKNNLVRYKSVILKKIRKAIVAYITKNSSLISVSEKKQKVIKKITKSMDKLMQKLERMPTYEEIAEDSGVSEIIVIQLLSAMNNVRSFENTENVDRLEYKIIQFNEYEESEDKKEEADIKDVKFKLSKYSHLLLDREEKVLRLLYGYWGISFDYRDVMNILDISYNQVKNIEKLALKKLKYRSEPLSILGYVVIV